MSEPTKSVTESATESPALISGASRDFWRQVFDSERRAYLDANRIIEPDGDERYPVPQWDEEPSCDEEDCE